MSRQGGSRVNGGPTNPVDATDFGTGYSYFTTSQLVKMP